MIIRHARPDEGDVLVQIWRSSVAATHGFVSRADLAAIDEEVQRLLPGTPLWLALHADGRPIAFMGVSGDSLDSLFVAAEHIGRGVGRKLVEFAKSARSHLTTAVNEANTPALGFYEHLGFRVIGRSHTDEDGRPYPVLHLRWDYLTRDHGVGRRRRPRTVAAARTILRASP